MVAVSCEAADLLGLHVPTRFLKDTLGLRLSAGFRGSLVPDYADDSVTVVDNGWSAW
jgi:hypothetical protein